MTVFDNSPAQLRQDAKVAREHDLDLRTVQGDMADLSAFADESFDLVFTRSRMSSRRTCCRSGARRTECCAGADGCSLAS